MSHVVPLKPAKEDEELGIWFCNCGSYSFKLNERSEAICLICGDNHGTGMWAHDPRPNSMPVHPTPTTAISVRSDGTVDFALKEAIRKIDAEKTLALVIIQHNAAVTTWGGSETPEHEKIIVEEMATAQQLLLAKR